MPPLADREQFEAKIVADLAPIFRAQYERAVASPTDIPYSEFSDQLQHVLSEDLAEVFSSAGAAMVNGLGIVFTSGLFERQSRSWAIQHSRELAGQIVDTSRDLAESGVERAEGDPVKLRDALGLVFLSNQRLQNIAITEVTRAVSAGEHAVVIPYNQAIGSSFARAAPDLDIQEGDEAESGGEEEEHESEELRDKIGEEAEESDIEAELKKAVGSKARFVPHRRDPEGHKLIPIWRINPKSNVCEHCAPLNGHSREFWALTYPMGPPGHPRCILAGNRVSFPGEVIAATKAFYVGRCVEATLADGRKIAVTGNHPVLTDKGWIAAKLLHEGCNVFSTSDADRVSRSVVPDNQNVPSLVEDVFRSFVKSSRVLAASMPPSPEDFHGDARFFDGQVDVVNKLGFLGNSLDSTLRKQLAKKRLKHRYSARRDFSSPGHFDHFGVGKFATAAGSVSRPDNCSSLLIRSPLPPVLYRRRHSPRLNSCLRQSQPECSTRDPGLRRQGLLCFAGQVSLDQSIESWNVNPYSRTCAKASSVASATQLGPHGNESSPQDMVIAADLASEFQNRFAGLISPQKIVNVRNFDWSGHVYDFQCEPYELYFCNDVIVHNCACHIEWIEARVWARRAA